MAVEEDMIICFKLVITKRAGSSVDNAPVRQYRSRKKPSAHANPSKDRHLWRNIALPNEAMNGVFDAPVEEYSRACGSCPSSTTTMKMGIERVLKEKFGEAIKDICQVEETSMETTVEAVNNHLEILRPAIRNYGGSVEVVSIEGGDCSVRYTGPDSIGTGIKAAIKEKFPDIINVVFTD